jgi:hypothetical protein
MEFSTIPKELKMFSYYFYVAQSVDPISILVSTTLLHIFADLSQEYLLRKPDPTSIKFIQDLG